MNKGVTAAKGIARTLVDRMPTAAQSQVRKLVHRRNYRADLVPVSELEKTYRDGIRWLLSENDGEDLGDYLEFGVCRGASMVAMHSAMRRERRTEMRMFGFDSFEGLPDNADQQDNGVWQPGWYDSDLELTKERMSRAGIDWRRTFLVEGWFTDTLTPALRIEHDLTSASIIMIDCDIYTSTVEALSFCEPLIGRRSVIVFDDWNSFDLAEQGLGERLAFDEFCEKHSDIVVLDDRAGYNAESRIMYVGRDPLL